MLTSFRRRRFIPCYDSSDNSTDETDSDLDYRSYHDATPTFFKANSFSRNFPKPTSANGVPRRDSVAAGSTPAPQLTFKDKVNWHLDQRKYGFGNDNGFCTCLGNCSHANCLCRKQFKTCGGMCLCISDQCQNLKKTGTPGDSSPTPGVEVPSVKAATAGTGSRRGRAKTGPRSGHTENKENIEGAKTAVDRVKSLKGGHWHSSGDDDRLDYNDLDESHVDGVTERAAQPLSSANDEVKSGPCHCFTKCMSFRCGCHDNGRLCESSCTCLDVRCQNRRMVDRPDKFYEDLDIGDLLRPVPLPNTTPFDTMMDYELKTYCQQRGQDLQYGFTPEGIDDMAWPSLCKSFAKVEN